MSPEEKLKMDLMLQERTPLSVKQTEDLFKSKLIPVPPAPKSERTPLTKEESESLGVGSAYIERKNAKNKIIKDSFYTPDKIQGPENLHSQSENYLKKIKKIVPSTPSSTGYAINPKTGKAGIEFIAGRSIADQKEIDLAEFHDTFSRIEKDLPEEKRRKYLDKLFQMERDVAKKQGLI